MSTPTLIESPHSANGGGSTTIALGAGTAVDDVLLCFCGHGAQDLAHALPPTGPVALMNLAESIEVAGQGFFQLYWGVVTTPGIQNVTFPSNGGYNTLLSIKVLRGADTTNPIDDSDVGSYAFGITNTPNSPAIFPGQSDSYLFCSALSGGAANSTFISQPPGMTDQGQDSAFGTLATAGQILTASGNTGAKPWSFNEQRVWLMSSVAVKGAAGPAGPPKGSLFLPFFLD